MGWRIKKIGAGIGNQRRERCKNEEQWQKIIIYMIKYKGKWE
jgi:hypothetical protein